MVHILISIILPAICYFKGNWRNWKAYYPTILLFILGDAVYNFGFFNYPLWTYKSEFFVHTIVDLYWAVLIFPCIVILFLTYMPQKKGIQAVYITAWAAGYALVEFGMYLLDSIGYSNGWNTFYSFLFDIAMFAIMWAHYKKPLIVWPLLALIVPVFVFIVGMPLAGLK